MKTIYQAFDGTPFEDQDECIGYELSLHNKELFETHKVIFLDSNDKPIKDITDIDNVKHAFFPSRNSIEIYDEYLENDIITNDIFDGNDIHYNEWYHYDDTEYGFYSAEEKIEEIKTEEEYYRKLLENL